MIDGLFTNGSMPVLERLVAFTSARHQALTHNIANLNTPYFEPTDLDPRKFQQELRRALKHRRHGEGVSMRRPIELDERRENILFHDRNNRDLERIMQDLAENTLAHRAGIDLLKNQFDMLKMAIRERI